MTEALWPTQTWISAGTTSDDHCTTITTGNAHPRSWGQLTASDCGNCNGKNEGTGSGSASILPLRDACSISPSDCGDVLTLHNTSQIRNVCARQIGTCDCTLGYKAASAVTVPCGLQNRDDAVGGKGLERGRKGSKIQRNRTPFIQCMTASISRGQGRLTRAESKQDGTMGAMTIEFR